MKMEKSTSLVRTRDLSVGYDREFPVLDGITLDVAAGELVAVIGPNGCGKTTFLRALTKVLPPSKGVIYVSGRELDSLSVREMAKRVGVVPQEDVIAFDFTVEDVVAMGRHPHRRPFSPLDSENEEIVRRAMAATGTWALRGRLVTEISGGERKRVVIARALAQEPRILLLDEPTSNLDLNYQQEILGLMADLAHARGIGIVLVLHDLNLAAHYVDRVVLLDARGKIHAAGTPEEVITADNIEEVYGCSVLVTRHPITGHVQITLGFRKASAKRLRVHIICGAGTGKPVMTELAARGHHITAGVLNEGDSDLETAQVLGITTVSEEFGCPISDRARRENEQLLSQAEAAIVCPVPFGWGNLANLEVLLQGPARITALLNIPPVEERDFTEGKAAALYEALLQRPNTKGCQTPEELVDWLERTNVSGSGA